MALPLIIAGAGAAAGFGLSAASGKSAATSRRRGRRRRAALSNLFRSSLVSDPLLQQILEQAQGASFTQAINPREIFKGASQQVETLSARREEDALEQLAAFGIDRNSAQGLFLNRGFERARVRQLGNLRSLIDTTAIQQNPQFQLQAAMQSADAIARQKELDVAGL